jgi:hypothetical protein
VLFVPVEKLGTGDSNRAQVKEAWYCKLCFHCCDSDVCKALYQAWLPVRHCHIAFGSHPT